MYVRVCAQVRASGGGEVVMCTVCVWCVGGVWVYVVCGEVEWRWSVGVCMCVV